MELVGHHCACAKALTTPTIVSLDSHVIKTLEIAIKSCEPVSEFAPFYRSDASGKKAGLIRHRSSFFIPCIQYVLQEALNAR